jgi:cytochrome P450
MTQSISLRASAIAAAAVIVSLSAIKLKLRRHKRVQDEKDDLPLPYPPTPSHKHWLWRHAQSLAPNPDSPHQSHDLLFLEWSKKLNSKVIMFEIPIKGRFVVVCDASIAKYILMGNHIKSPTYASLVPLIGRKSMVATEGQTWSTQRRLYNPCFDPSFLKNCVSTIVEKCNRFIAKCDEDIDSGRATNMLSRAVDLTSDVLAQLAFGEDWGCDENEEGLATLQTIRELTSVVGENMRNPLLQLSLRQRIKTWRLSRSLEQAMQRLVHRRLKAMECDDSNKKDILTTTLSHVLKSNTAAKISFSSSNMENMTSQLQTFYFAGHDTTATTIAWAFWLLVQHPQVIQRAREEVITHLGKEWAEQAQHAKQLNESSYEALQKCEYLDAVARETLRLYPPAASTRYTSDPNANAGGFKLGDAIVHVNFYAIQRDPDVWEDADSFIPDRFLGEEGQKRIASFSFLPFSKGMRDCIGKYFALIETKVALAVLISRYDASVVDGVELYGSRLTSIPMGGCKVELRRRLM